jgi:hypothetical protein
MRPSSRLVGLALLAIVAIAATGQGEANPAEGPATITVCQFFQNPLIYSNQVIAVRGKWRLGAHSASVYDDGCGKPCTTSNAGFPWEPRTLTWPCAIHLDLKSLPAPELNIVLRLVDTANQGRTETEIMGTFVGRLEMKEQYAVATPRYFSQPIGIGYGDAGVHAAQIAVNSVRHVAVLPSLSTQVVETLRPLTVCDVFRDLQRYNGMPLAVLGVEVSGKEAQYLWEGGCEAPLVTGAHKWGNQITFAWKDRSAPSPPASFRIDPVTLAVKSARVKSQTPLEPRSRGYHDRLVVVYGRFETRERFVEVKIYDGVAGNGFGHMGFAPAQLLVVGVAAIKVLEVAEPSAGSNWR